jgi:hypothetical protein
VAKKSAPVKESKKASKPEKASKVPAKIVTVADLAEEFGKPGQEIRLAIRSLGLRAPAVQSEGFGPRSKYSWAEGSAELKQIREAIKNAPARGTRKAKAAEAEEEDESEEDED